MLRVLLEGCQTALVEDVLCWVKIVDTQIQTTEYY